MNNQAYLSVGSNLGDRQKNLNQAVNLLNENAMITVEKVSPIYQTQPVGGVPQDDFLNIAIRLSTTLTAHELLDVLHQIEQALRRKRLIHWGPRTIDLDILYFNHENIHDETLIVPHPEIAKRRFVLIPLLDVLNDDQLITKTNQQLQTTPDHNWVEILHE
ncbi:2-amino-4-hydroxy-6-hydroxymethyldihydropteridine diphosphokinase [Pediococcus ethanolidurans]|uniref:2-amino-4-hydroxy-6- hydroxymethyldihydropteridine diphosphokinase n=1 Tax=Pediococcus ethanolidurans TaxID=319653 RepID=UPI001C1EC1BE|nr:2-amino-4-hydroxy-6-hydroxymethyldihydropteridine diphosphokinase [Pediococcus ethanolidurans]MBU7554673.1 2-amino-4-hydroxy-6-hydroxymethyldihydropteridine diphosphokinase [Pediococcus ethanolidurans]MBU7564499.1 2-amino-4-hydroxy-6-hydroxymethyldihydropteridine diphosphokinase [Pediococcus ethanolidurans]MCT4397834.1 2-amino-4-hydroxy-6-hydroxymethyldihydropteridine diphosphokinase [Pediococcus ethanolidurans]MCV3316271.1 2-amino-4-hydroxy-6-hydroxymethyldihydropteridine diphosphokinase [P